MTPTLKNIEYEKTLWNKGIKIVAGVDEVGRGCLAGPLVACAVVWPSEITTWQKTAPVLFETLSLITDSKKTTQKRREMLSEFIIEHCLEYAIEEVSAHEIDQHGVGEANKKALEKVALSINGVEHILVDHYKIFASSEAGSCDSMHEPESTRTKLDCSDRKIQPNSCNPPHPPPSTSITKGDLLSISIASASIVAKVYRDNLMREKYHPIYPQYGFDKHVGYGTKLHFEAIKAHGLSKIHRKSFKTRHCASKLV